MSGKETKGVSMRTQERFSRQLGILDPDKLKARVTVIGAGGIGSWTVAMLSRIGFEDITVYDDDIVSEVNLGYQFFRDKDIGKSKVEALKDFIYEFSKMNITAKNELYKGGDYKELMICAVDSMDTRVAIWDKVKMKPQIKCYVDARMGAEIMRIYTLCPTDIDNIAEYEKELYPSSEAEQGDCSFKSICYNTGTIASFIINNVKKHFIDGKSDKEIFFDLKTMALVRR